MNLGCHLHWIGCVWKRLLHEGLDWIGFTSAYRVSTKNKEYLGLHNRHCQIYEVQWMGDHV